MLHAGREHSKSQSFCGLRDRRRTLQLCLQAGSKLHCGHNNVTTFHVIITQRPNATRSPKPQENPKGQYHFLRGKMIISSVDLQTQENFEER